MMTWGSVNKLAPTSVERLVFVNTVKHAYCLQALGNHSLIRMA